MECSLDSTATGTVDDKPANELRAQLAHLKAVRIVWCRGRAGGGRGRGQEEGGEAPTSQWTLLDVCRGGFYFLTPYPVIYSWVYVKSEVSIASDTCIQL